MEIRKFDQIDGLRFFAVFSVVCIHWNWAGTTFCNRIDTGVRGVDLFFVISGFLITLGLIRSKEAEKAAGTSLYKFYARRFLRIVPVYYLTIALVWCFDHARIADSFWWDVFYLTNFYSIKINGFCGVGHFWSLSVEEQFYLVWPFIILLTPKRGLPIVMLLSVFISLAVKSYWHFFTTSSWIAYFHPVASLDALSIGGILSYLYYYHENKLKEFLHNLYITISVFILFGLCLFSLKTPYSFVYFIGVRTIYGFFCAWWIGRAVFGFGGIIGAILNNSILRYIGTISYSIYLFHPFIPELLKSLVNPDNQNLNAGIYAIVLISLSSLSWYAFEKPILKLKSRFQ